MGLAFAAPPGIVTAETFRRGILRGFPGAFSVQLGSLIGDAAYCLLALAGVAVLVQNPVTQRALGVVSVVFLLALAIHGIVSELRAARAEGVSADGLEHSDAALAGQVRSPRGGAGDHRKNAFFTGMFLSLTNPWAIGFWLSLGGTLAAFGAMDSGSTMALFFVGFFGACLGYAVLLAYLVGVTRRAIPSRLGRIISIACSAVIGILGVGVAVQVAQMFLS
jgi:threonine/homoserine/homoserine lactone efflux protein